MAGSLTGKFRHASATGATSRFSNLKEIDRPLDRMVMWQIIFAQPQDRSGRTAWLSRARLLLSLPTALARPATFTPNFLGAGSTGRTLDRGKQLQRGVHHSTRQLEADIRAFIDKHNEDPKPFKWTKSADDILAADASVSEAIKTYATNFRFRC